MRILFLTHRLPFAPNRGDRIRAYHLLAHLSGFAEVSLFSLVHDDEEEAAVATVPCADVTCARVSKWGNRVRGALALPSRRPLTHSLLRPIRARQLLSAIVTRTKPDLVFAFGSGMARLALEPPLAGIPLVLDMVDVDSVKWAELAERSPWPLRQIYRRETHTLRRFEEAVSRTARATLVVNEREADALSRISSDARIDIVPNGIDVESFRRSTPAVAEPRVVFCGVMDYEPNAWGVQWFVERVWPEVRRRFPHASLKVVGANPTRPVRALAEADRSVQVTGAVPRTQPFLWEAAVAVAPIHIARGLQNKVLEALAAGLPVVVTPAVARGIPESLKVGYREGSTAAEFTRQLIKLLAMTAAERLAISSAANVEALSWPSQLTRLERILCEATEGADYPRETGRPAEEAKRSPTTTT